MSRPNHAINAADPVGHWTQQECVQSAEVLSAEARPAEHGSRSALCKHDGCWGDILPGLGHQH